jgi:ABC-type cobalamin transport system ATPase subunit
MLKKQQLYSSGVHEHLVLGIIANSFQQVLQQMQVLLNITDFLQKTIREIPGHTWFRGSLLNRGSWLYVSIRRKPLAAIVLSVKTK